MFHYTKGRLHITSKAAVFCGSESWTTYARYMETEEMRFIRPPLKLKDWTAKGTLTSVTD